MEQHRQLLGILWLVYSVFPLIDGGMLIIIANTIFSRHFGGQLGHPGGPPVFLHPLLTFIGVLLLLKGIAGLAAGWGLLQRLPWARVLSLVVGIVSLLNLPFGTALGVYTLWVVRSSNAEQEYRALTGSAGKA